MLCGKLVDRRALGKQQQSLGLGSKGGYLTEKCQIQRQQMGEDQEEERERSVDS